VARELSWPLRVTLHPHQELVAAGDPTDRSKIGIKRSRRVPIKAVTAASSHKHLGRELTWDNLFPRARWYLGEGIRFPWN
jgi:hypothetical protein